MKSANQRVNKINLNQIKTNAAIQHFKADKAMRKMPKLIGVLVMIMCSSYRSYIKQAILFLWKVNLLPRPMTRWLIKHGGLSHE